MNNKPVAPRWITGVLLCVAGLLIAFCTTAARSQVAIQPCQTYEVGIVPIARSMHRAGIKTGVLRLDELQTMKFYDAAIELGFFDQRGLRATTIAIMRREDKPKTYMVWMFDTNACFRRGIIVLRTAINDTLNLAFGVVKPAFSPVAYSRGA